MVAWKVFLTVGILALVVTSGVLYFVPDYRPGFVQSWIRSSRGLGPAKSPEEALAKFQKAIQARDFESAAVFCTAEYAEQMRKCAKQASELSLSIDGLVHALQNVAKIDAPRTMYVLSLLEPFPVDFTYEIRSGTDGPEAADARITLSDAKLSKAGSEMELKIPSLRLDSRIQRPLLPRIQDVARGLILREVVMEVRLKSEGEKEKVWKIDFPVTAANADVNYPGMRESVEFLQKNGANYAEALDNLKDSLKKDAETKSNIDSELRKQLNDVELNKQR
jgi:hypothetical protein